MAKSVLSIAVAAGAAALLLMPKGKPKSSKPSKKTGDDDRSGTVAGWEWRVIEKGDGFGLPLFFGEIRKVAIGPNAAWTPAHDKGRSRAVEARNLAWERIAQETASTPSQPAIFNWEPARATTELELRKQYPDVRLTVMDHGSTTNNSGKCSWAIMSVLPPIPEGAYAGFLICPSTGENQSRFSDSIPNIKDSLQIV